MDERETRALFKRGREAWNEWAAPFVKQHVELLAKDDAPGKRQALDKLCHQARVAIDNDLIAEGGLEFAGFLIPGNLELADRGTLRRPLNFAGVQFYGDTRFSNLQEVGGVNFKAAKFFRKVLFNQLTCGGGNFNFDDAEFCSEAAFIKLSGGSGLSMSGATLLDTVLFQEVEGVRLDLSDAHFCGDAEMRQLRGDMRLANTRFDGKLGIHALKCQTADCTRLTAAKQVQFASWRVDSLSCKVPRGGRRRATTTATPTKSATPAAISPPARSQFIVSSHLP